VVKGDASTAGKVNVLTDGSMEVNGFGDKLESSAYTAADVLTKLKTVDENNSGLNASTLQGSSLAEVRPLFLKGASGVAGTDINLGIATNGGREYLATIDYNETSAGNVLKHVRAFVQFYGLTDTRNVLTQHGFGTIQLYKYTGADGFLHLWIPTTSNASSIFPSTRIEVSEGYADSNFVVLPAVVSTRATAPTQTLIAIPDNTVVNATTLQGTSLNSFRLAFSVPGLQSQANTPSWKPLFRTTLPDNTGNHVVFLFDVMGGNLGAWNRLVDGTLFVAIRNNQLYGFFRFDTVNGVLASNVSFGYTGAVTMGSVFTLWAQFDGYAQLILTPKVGGSFDKTSLLNEPFVETDPGVTLIPNKARTVS
jgi:hypothetical protein